MKNALTRTAAAAFVAGGLASAASAQPKYESQPVPVGEGVRQNDGSTCFQVPKYQTLNSGKVVPAGTDRVCQKLDGSTTTDAAVPRAQNPSGSTQYCVQTIQPSGQQVIIPCFRR